MLEIDHSTTSALLRDAAGEVEQIRNLLDDVYKDAGDGRTIVRELVQNADDAEATSLSFALVREGWKTKNDLLEGPALLVFNDGPFEASHQEGIRKAIGGSKRADEAKVGRFGLGLKSVFHLAEAFIFLGSDGERLRPGVVNPWAETARDGAHDPIHGEWDALTDDDVRRLESVAASLGPPEVGGYLLLWIPLRRATHLDRYVGGGGIRDLSVAPEGIASWFDSETAISLLLPQCRHLMEVQFFAADSLVDLGNQPPVIYVRKEARRGRPWRGANGDETGAEYSCRITRRDSGVIVEALGVQELGHTAGTLAETLREDWPKEDVAATDGSHRRKRIPRKAIPHGSITLVKRVSMKEPKGHIYLRWSVFLPLDDNACPTPEALHSSQQVLRGVALGDGHPTWDLMLHGYFWPSQDRRSVPGLVSVDGGTGADAGVRERWNLAVGRELVLPLLPTLVAQALAELPVQDASARVRAVDELIKGEARATELRRAMVSKTWLLPMLDQDGVRYRAVVAGTETIALQDWTSAPPALRGAWHRAWTNRGVSARDENLAALGGRSAAWPDVLWLDLLEDDGGVVWNVPEHLEWFECVVRREQRRRQPHDLGEARRAMVRWFRRVAKAGYLEARTVNDDEATERDRHRAALVQVASSLPDLPVLAVPVGAAAAVRDLAACVDLDGVPAVLLPVGSSVADDQLSAPSQNAVREVLLVLGRRLRDRHDVTRALRKSWLALASELIRLISEAELRAHPELSQLPLLPVARFPKDESAALTVSELVAARDAHRVFSREGEVRDPKAALAELADVLGEPCWMLPERAEWASAFQIRPVSASALAEGLLAGSTDLVSNEAGMAARKALAGRVLEELTTERQSGEETRRRAARLLLAGRRCTPPSVPLFRVPSRPNSILEQAAVAVLSIIDLEHTLIPASLTGQIRVDQLELLDVEELDASELRTLAKRVLEQHPEATLDSEQWLSIIRATFDPTDEFARLDWKALPIHRTTTGVRTPVTDRSLRSRGEELPVELRDDAVLLDPERIVEEFYNDVPRQDAKGVVRLALATARPWDHWTLVFDLIASENAGCGQLSDDWRRSVGKVLFERPWLPQAQVGPPESQPASGVAPAQLALLSPSLAQAVTPFVKAGCTRHLRLVESVSPEAWRRCAPLVRWLIEQMGRGSPVDQLVEALSLVALYAQGPCSTRSDLGIASGNGDWLSRDHVRTGMRTLESHAGWILLREVADACPDWEEDTNSPPFRVKAALAAPTLGAREARVLVEPLTRLNPAAGTRERDLFLAYLDHFGRRSYFWADVLPTLKLPTQAGTWSLPGKIARTRRGLRKEHLLVKGAWEALGVDEQAPKEQTPEAGLAGMRAGERLRELFKSWEGCLPSSAVGAFLALLGDGNENLVGQVAREWLEKDSLTAETLRAHLVEGLERDPQISRTLVYVRVVEQQDATVEVPDLLGREARFSLADGRPSILAADPQRNTSAIAVYWTLHLRALDPRVLAHTDLVDILGEAAVDIAVSLHKIPRERALAWWSGRVASSQVAVGPIRRLILDDIPLILSQLDVRHEKSLSEELAKIKQLKTQKQLLAGSQMQERESIERRIAEAFRRIEQRLETDEGLQRFLLERVRARITNFRYSPESVLLELFQNADDALIQLEEARGSEPLPAEARRVEVVVHAGADGPVVEFTHWGRSINDSWSADFADRGWDQDLYHMLLMNLSAKPGQDEAAGPSTTGKFGLGFKSVHLITLRPTVFSGFIRFYVHGGLLPFETREDWPSSYEPVGDIRPTTIRLPLDVAVAEGRGDTSMAATALVDQLMGRFQDAAPYLPAFSRGVKHIRVRTPGVEVDFGTSFHPVPGAAGWSVSAYAQPLGLDSRGTLHGRLLRFQVDAALDRELGGVLDRASFGCSLVVAVGSEGVVALPESVSSLWCLAPTSARWALGYIVNGPFELDAGRWGIAVDGKQTLGVARRFGVALCDGLKRLHDALMRDPAAHAELLGVTAALVFLGQLWRVLAPDPRRREPPTREFLRLMQGESRGAAGWAESCGVVPTEMPSPFASHLARGTRKVRIAADSLLTDAGVEALSASAVLLDLCQRVPLVSKDIFVRLRGDEPHPVDDTYGLRDLLEDWIKDKGGRVKAEDLDELAGLAAIDWNGLRDMSPRVEFMTGDGGWARASDVVFDSLPDECGDSSFALPDIEDEVLRAAFAPAAKRMGASYAKTVERVIVAHRLRGGLVFKVSDLVSWVSDGSIDEARNVAALRYVVAGKYGRDFADAVKVGNAPPWMRDRDEVLMLTATGWAVEDRQRVLFELFGAPENWGLGEDDVEGEEEPTAEYGSEPIPVLSDGVAAKLLNQLWEQLSDEAKRAEVSSAYHQRWYPQKWGLPGVIGAALRGEGSTDEEHEAWMVLFVLGTVQRLGRTQPMQHRGFIEELQSSTLARGGQSWWEALFGRNADAESWFACLEEWAHRRNYGSVTFEHWFTLLPELFAAWRWAGEYQELLVKLDRRESLPPGFMASRTDPFHQLGGVNAPALPAFRVSWAVRELLRLGVLRHTKPLSKHCIPFSRKLESIMELLGQRPLESSWQCLARLVGEDRAQMHGLYDVALLSPEFSSLLDRASLDWRAWTSTHDDWDDEGSGDLGGLGADRALHAQDEERRQESIAVLNARIEKLEDRIPKLRAFDRATTPPNEWKNAAMMLLQAEAELQQCRARLHHLLNSKSAGAPS